MKVSGKKQKILLCLLEVVVLVVSLKYYIFNIWYWLQKSWNKKESITPDLSMKVLINIFWWSLRPNLDKEKSWFLTISHVVVSYVFLVCSWLIMWPICNLNSISMCFFYFLPRVMPDTSFCYQASKQTVKHVG